MQSYAFIVLIFTMLWILAWAMRLSASVQLLVIVPMQDSHSSSGIQSGMQIKLIKPRSSVQQRQRRNLYHHVESGVVAGCHQNAPFVWILTFKGQL